MDPPEARLHLGGSHILLLGTISGYTPDAQRVRAAFDAHRPDAVALGVPREDLADLQALAEATEDSGTDLPELDRATERLLELLERFGRTRVPSPDLEAAHAAAAAAGVPLLDLDLDDRAHTELYVRTVKLRHVIRSNKVLKRLMKEEFQDAADPYTLAVRWDRYQTQVDALRAVERAREEHMARRLQHSAARHPRLLAVVPAARFDGVVASLRPSTPS